LRANPGKLGGVGEGRKVRDWEGGAIDRGTTSLGIDPIQFLEAERENPNLLRSLWGGIVGL